MTFDELQSVGYDSKMLSLSKWRRRISKAWRKKVKRKRCHMTFAELTTRIQDGHYVSLIIWPHKHQWAIYLQPGKEDRIQIKVDRPLSQAELFRWLAKTQPIEE